MRSSVIAFLLCACTAAAMGQCVSPAARTATANKAAAATAAAAAAATTPAVILMTPARQAATTRPGAARPGAELITAAGAVTHDGPVMQATPRAEPDPEGDRPRRAGPAMLLAALALMSGIALRRYSARDQ